MDEDFELKQQERKEAFKKGVDQDESRAKREKDSVQIRKSRRDEQLMKRRKDVLPLGAPMGAFGAPSIVPVAVGFPPATQTTAGGVTPVAGVQRFDAGTQSKVCFFAARILLIFVCGRDFYVFFFVFARFCLDWKHTHFVAIQLVNLPQWTAMVNSTDAAAQYEGTKEFRKLLSVGAFLFPIL
jgi:hypothetical protein